MKRIVLLLIGMLAVLIACNDDKGITMKGDYSKDDAEFFASYYSGYADAIHNEDIDAIKQYYSDSYYTELGGDSYSGNTRRIFDFYDNITYTAKEIVITVAGDKAAANNVFTYTGEPAPELSIAALNINGNEYIWWSKENGKWLIVNYSTEVADSAGSE